MTKKEYQKKWREDNKPRVLELRVKHKYNITIETYNECMRSSNCCEVCGLEENLCYDHDHNTEEFRGVLCRTCNTAIGMLGDNIQGLNRALMYLRKYKNKGDK
jgi:hypothetical protein